jgi:hypothetical protein
MDAFEILVVVLSLLLGLILVIGVIVGVLLIKITRDIRFIVHKASLAADNIQHAAALFKSTSSIAALGKVLGNAVEMFKKSPKRGDK